MQKVTNSFTNIIYQNNDAELRLLLSSGVNPNFEGGWPIRQAARCGCYTLVKTFLQYGANPHLLSESGASLLQLAVFSGKFWETDNWNFLLACCDSAQLAEGAAVAIIFLNLSALNTILDTKRCGNNIPTRLTGKTVAQLIKAYKLNSLPSTSTSSINHCYFTPNSSPILARNTLTAQTVSQPNNNLSPSVARFFYQSAGQPSLTSPRSPVATAGHAFFGSPITEQYRKHI